MYCVLAASGANNADAYSNNVIFTIKDIKAYVRAGIIKYYNITINGKTFYYQQADFNVKQYEEVKTLATGQDEDYTTQDFCLIMDTSKIVIN